jgi:hypothetical protein
MYGHGSRETKKIVPGLQLVSHQRAVALRRNSVTLIPTTVRQERAKGMSRPPADAPLEEIDVWWGSYAGRAMMPSFAVCVLLTAACLVAARQLAPERGLLQLTFTALASTVWLVQLLRWCHRFFTCNYRLTTSYLYIDRGFRPLVARRFALATIRAVEVQQNRWEQLLGVGNVRVYFEDAKQPPAVLPALVRPDDVAAIIRGALKTTGVRSR